MAAKELPPSIKRQSQRMADRSTTGQFVAGNGAALTAKPRMTPVGNKAALSHAFIKALHADFVANGKVVVEDVRKSHPEVYFRVVASLVPKELIIDTSNYDNASMKELQERFNELSEMIENDIRALANGEDARIREIEGTAIDVTPPRSAA